MSEGKLLNSEELFCTCFSAAKTGIFTRKENLWFSNIKSVFHIGYLGILSRALYPQISSAEINTVILHLQPRSSAEEGIFLFLRALSRRDSSVKVLNMEDNINFAIRVNPEKSNVIQKSHVSVTYMSADIRSWISSWRAAGHGHLT